MDLSAKIKALRKHRGLTQWQLAELVHTTQSSICKFESATYGNHNLRTVCRIAKALDASVEIEFKY